MKLKHRTQPASGRAEPEDVIASIVSPEGWTKFREQLEELEENIVDEL